MTSRWRSLLPAGSDYRITRVTWRADLIAGVTVGVVALPLALAFGISSGAGAEAGLVTAIVAGMVAAIFGGSPVQVSGPTGAMVVVLAPIVATQGAGSLALVCVMAGVLVIAAGIAGLGRAIAYIPWPVIEGFTLGIAAIIFLQQVPAATGSHGHDTNAAVAAWQALSTATFPQAAWTVGAVAAIAAVMVVAPRYWTRVPASMLAIVVVTLVSVLVKSPMTTIGALPAGLPAPRLPAISLHALRSLAGPAFAVAALAAVESLLSARVAAAMADGGELDADRELVGQGLASVAAGFFGGMPATGAIARTAVNVRVGGRSRLAAITHALVLAGVVYFAAPLVAHIPLAALAGVLIVTATRMFRYGTFRAVAGAGRSTLSVFAITAFVTVSFDLIVAVGIGVAVTAVLALRSIARTNVVHREEIADPQTGDERIALLRIDGAMYFGSGERITEQVLSIPNVDVVVIRMSQLQLFDATGARLLADLIQQLERRGITVILKGIKPEHRQLAHRLGVVTSLRHHNHLTTHLDEAIEHARGHVGPSTANAPGSAHR